MIDIYNKRPKNTKQTKLIQKRKISNTAVPGDFNATTISHNERPDRATRKSKKVTSTLRQLALTVGECLIRA